jgi:hypothetical protein
LEALCYEVVEEALKLSHGNKLLPASAMPEASCQPPPGSAFCISHESKNSPCFPTPAMILL